MKIHNQPTDGPLGEKLFSWLSLNTGTFYGISAFVKNSGILILEEALINFKKNNGAITFIVGIDFDGTSVEALKNLFRLSDNLYIVHSESNITFHPKIYFIENGDDTKIAIGSNNLTRGGLFTNYEVSLICEDSHKNETIISDVNTLISQFTDITKNSVKKIKTIDDINYLYDAGYIYKEKEIQMNIIKNKKKKKIPKTTLFGNEETILTTETINNTSINSSLLYKQDLNMQNSNYTQHSPIQNEFFWFETKKLTGGARNILDLSKQGKLQKGSACDTVYFLDQTMVKGGVNFFGVNPETPIEKEITINFDGTNFFPSTIKYTPDNSNWRIQIKGTNNIGVTITSILKDTMINQILLFEKTNDTNYVMSIVPVEELKHLQEHSVFWATNGKSANGRKFGYILKK